MEKKEILLLQEAERKRIAEELHDTTVQDMICLSHQLELISVYMDQDVIQAKLETAVARKRIKRVISEMRETIYDLRPMVIDDIGWQALFERLREKLLCENPYMDILFGIDPVDLSDGITALSIYRIVCEGCQNIVKHSSADRIEISVKNNGSMIKIRIQDNGVGIGNATGDGGNHFGLQYMSERVDALSGKMDIISDSSGTRIKIQIPVERGDEK